MSCGRCQPIGGIGFDRSGVWADPFGWL